ncbi:MAG TPA: DUF1592 domain-containing protein [Polyangiaceae bacterium]
MFSSVLALGMSLAGCTGMVAGSGTGSNPDNTGGMGTGTAGGGGVVPPGGGSGGAAALVAGVDLMHRLNTNEYNATVQDVLGTTLHPADGTWRAESDGGFDNIAAVLGIDDDQYVMYVDAGKAIAEDVFAAPALQAKVLTCTTADDMTCVSSIINQTGQRVLRRPLLADEVASFSKVYTDVRAQGEDHASAIKDVLWAMLSSSQFLYRMEFDNGATMKHLISGYELASRLSYFLWSSAPDDMLLAAASQLTTDATLSSSVDRMLADPKAERFIENFSGQWLGGRITAVHPADKTLYPMWTPDVAAAASQEMYQYFGEFLKKNLPWTDFLKTDINFVNQPLAALYGIPNVTGTALTRTVYTTDQRAGFLGLAGWLAGSSVAARSSPTTRGKWLLMNMLCFIPDSPPAGVPKLEDNGMHPEAANVRTALEAHRASPACAGCHAFLDPMGLALEKYDGIGRYRTAYPNGSAIDDSTELAPSKAFATDTKFSGLDGTSNVVANDPRFKSCVSEKLYLYSMGRALSTDDVSNADTVAKQWQAGGDLSLSKLIHGLTVANAFRSRTPAL